MERRRWRRSSWRASFAATATNQGGVGRLPEGAQLPPGDRPGSLDRLVGEVEVSADDEAHPGHVHVVGLTMRAKANSSPLAASVSARAIGSSARSS